MLGHFKKNVYLSTHNNYESNVCNYNLITIA